MINSKPIISLNNVCFAYFDKPWQKKKSKWVLHEISFDLYSGETLGIIGRNGAGKSTLLSILAGLTIPDQGSFVNRSKSISLLSLQTGFIPQLTGRENIFLSSLTLGFSKKEIKSRLNDIIEFAELGEAINDPVKTYSTGMRARLGFSISIQIAPDIFLIDEVFGVGDFAFKKKSQEAMAKKIAGNQTVVLVSHQPNTVAEMCDRAMVLHLGRNIFIGDVKEAQKRYLEISRQPIISGTGRKN